MDNWMLLILGLFLCALGCMNLRGDISTIHFYNRRRVSREDIPKYGRAVGTGTVIMGASLVLAFFAALWSERLAAFIILPAFAVGLGFLLYAQFRYNKGIF